MTKAPSPTRNKNGPVGRGAKLVSSKGPPPQKTKMERVEVGLHVDIQRSDGRVHGAVISDIKRDKGVVTVEWFEKGETKGKEIEWNLLLKINPTLMGMGKPQLSQILSQSQINGNDLDETILMGNATASHPPPARQKPVATARTVVPPPAKEPPVPVSRLKAPSQSKLEPMTKLSIPPPQSRGSRQSLISPDSPPAVAAATLDGITDENEETWLTGGKDRTLKSEKIEKNENRGSTVAEIERLAKQRDERRAQQDRLKKQKEMEKQIDPGNPNYQFLTMIRDYQVQIDYRPLRMSDAVADNRITVCVRKRPLNKKELARKEIEVVTVPNKDHLIVHQPQVKVDLTKYLDNQKFRFDYAFDENAGNDMVYKFTAQPLVRTIFEQGNATCFAYGQTGSGKTHTMGGEFSGKNQNTAAGIYALAASDVFRLLSREYKHLKLTVVCCFFEIYGGKVFDLLKNKSILRVLEDKNGQVQIVGLKEEEVKDDQEVLDVIRRGTEQRTAGTTSANANSSRSHAVFQIVLKKGPKQWGKFSLIDLAGNERGVDTAAADRQTRQEGAEINKSLLALKECIRAMSMNTAHVPFRASKLTIVLRDSFLGEKARTCMIAMISPGMNSCEHTLNTLRYCDRVKELGADSNGVSTPMGDDELMLPPGSEEDEEADISLVYSRNGTSKDAMVLERAIGAMTNAEEKCLVDLAQWFDDNGQFVKERKSLMKKTENPDYDAEALSMDLESQMEKEMKLLESGLENVRKWRRAMKTEAELSKQKNKKK